MAKRAWEADEDHQSSKRSKQQPNAEEEAAVEEINFPRQLQQLLSFQQDRVDHLHLGIASSKAFLENILYRSDENDQAQRLSVLKEFLDSETPRDVDDNDALFLGQLWQAWSFANQTNDDHLSSSVCALFALLLKTLSNLIEFRAHGMRLCRTILQHQQLRLVKRCLDAPKHKDFLISPSLRLLIELVSFDGGVFAREAYKRREQTFDVTSLRKNLALVKPYSSEEEARRKPAPRTLALRYVLAHLKYQSEGGKIDILKQRPLCIALFSYLREDPPEVIIDILRTTESSVFRDNELPRSAKSALITHQHLERVTDVATRFEISDSTTEAALSWLKAVSSVSSYGILRSSGWYPPGTTRIDQSAQVDEDAVDLGLDSLEHWENDEKYLIRNTVLLSWIRTLRPSSDMRERELIISCFKAAPELVHAYFRDNALQMDPKLTNTWIGYASFLFEVIRLPVPERFGNTNSDSYADLPPQISIVMDNILPRPFTQKVLTRCLNQSSTLITFFAIRILVLAYEKFADIQRHFAKAAVDGPNRELWKEANGRLVDAFSQTCPKVKDVISVFRKMPDDEQNVLQREAVTRLLRFYYETTPLLALEEQFDVSTALVAALISAEQTVDGNDETKQIRSLEMEHLLAIAQNSTGMRWFQKQGGLQYSPFVTVLDLLAADRQKYRTRDMLSRILHEHSILNTSSESGKQAPIDALLASLSHSGSAGVMHFIDDCLVRVTRKPIKYLDDVDSIRKRKGEVGETPSILIAVLLEQAPFVVKMDQGQRVDIMRWINTFLSLLSHTTDTSNTLQAIQDQIHSTKGWDTSTDPLTEGNLLDGTVDRPLADDTVAVRPEEESDNLPFEDPRAENENHPELHRWQKKDLDLAIDDGDVAALILCLCSRYPEVCRQAHQQLKQLMGEIRASDLEEKDQIEILVGELLETFEQSFEAKREPLPHLVGTFVTHALHVQTDPAHFIYPKLNRYLMKGPEWRVSKMPSYWLSTIALSVPAEDDAYWREVQWVLEWLVDGLRTESDVELLRRAGSFERVMVICASPAAPEKSVKQKVLELVYRAALVDANTLATRTGVLSWLDVVPGSVSAKLREFILSQCDEKRLSDWAGVEVVR